MLRATVATDRINFLAPSIQDRPMWGYTAWVHLLFFYRTLIHTVSFSTPSSSISFSSNWWMPSLAPHPASLAAFKTLLIGAQRTTSTIFLSFFSFKLAAINGSLEDHSMCVCVCVCERKRGREDQLWSVLIGSPSPVSQSCTVTASISTPPLSCPMGTQAASSKRNNTLALLAEEKEKHEEAERKTVTKDSLCTWYCNCYIAPVWIWVCWIIFTPGIRRSSRVQCFLPSRTSLPSLFVRPIHCYSYTRIEVLDLFACSLCNSDTFPHVNIFFLFPIVAECHSDDPLSVSLCFYLSFF